MKGLINGFLILLLLLTGCSKNPVQSLEELLSSSSEELSSSSLALTQSTVVDTIPILMGSVWSVDSLAQGELRYYRVFVQTGLHYQVQWDDSLDGTELYNGDVQVNVLGAGSKALQYWWLDRDPGYFTVQTLVAEQDTLYVRVRARKSGTFALRVQPAPSQSSGAKLSSTTGSFIGNSSAILISSSLAPGSSVQASSSLIASSSSIASTGFGLGREWTGMTTPESGIQVITLVTTPGEKIWVQWMDLTWSEHGKAPTANVQVDVLDANGASLWGQSYDSSPQPILVVATSTKTQISIHSASGSPQLGSFFLRAYHAVSIERTYTPSSAWVGDSLLKGDTIVYNVATHAWGYNLAVNWNDQTMIGSAMDASLLVSVGTSLWEYDLSAYGHSYGSSTVYYSPYTVHTKVLAFAQQSGGHFAMHIEEIPILGSTISVDSTWTRTSIQYGDTLRVGVKVQVGKEYRLDWRDLDFATYLRSSVEKGQYTANVQMRPLHKNGSSYWNSYQTSSGYSVYTVTPTEDSMVVEIIGDKYGTTGMFDFRLFPVSSMYATKVLTPGASWHVDSLEFGDRVNYDIPVIPGKYYRIQGDGSLFGTGLYPDFQPYYSVFDDQGNNLGAASDNYSFAQVFLAKASFLHISGLNGPTSSIHAKYAIRAVPTEPIELYYNSTTLKSATIQSGELALYHVYAPPNAAPFLYLNQAGWLGSTLNLTADLYFGVQYTQAGWTNPITRYYQQSGYSFYSGSLASSTAATDYYISVVPKSDVTAGTFQIGVQEY